ncbi:rhomboid family intramembrane serine protease [Hymenobacter sp. RP-2-7]|uniref:Rhomboid family intramembrane serine protease n=1 Tax=Hymenobacter polaris TaxID=2682546 RepID=A0A7Y0AF20_9BACT|nr:rhomboid family intramembrane serine protease [Hymenobacter polaris]NML66169.1 rhomboid family intramembrane serine protease [Hymenobacter polaris]
MFWQSLRLKLRYIGWPYLRVWVVFVAVAAGLHAALAWLLPTTEPPEWLWIWAGPGVGCLLLVLLLLWPGFRLVRDGRNGSNLGQLLVVVAAATLAFAWGSLAFGLRAALSPLRPVATLTEAAALPARYYQVRQVNLDTARIGVEQRAEVTGRNNETLSLSVYVACPAAAAGRPATIPAWLGWHYSRAIQNRLPDQQKEAAYREFLQYCARQFVRDQQRPFTYLERCPNDGNRRGLLAAASRSPRYAAGTPPLLLLPRYEPFGQDTREPKQFFKWSQLLGNGVFLLLLLVLPLHPERRAQVLAGQLDRSHGWLTDYAKALWPRPGYVLTPLLLDANLVVFLLMVANTGTGLGSFDGPTLLAWGGDYGPAVAAGQWWRLLSSVFVHANLLHLGNNLVLLGLLGWQLELALGWLRPLVVYAVAGLGASLLSIWWHPATIGIGASGALFGWMGLALTLYWRPQATPLLKTMLRTVVLATGVVSLLLGFAIPGVDNAAHLGGLAVGALAGLVLWPWLRPALVQHAAALAAANEAASATLALNEHEHHSPIA